MRDIAAPGFSYSVSRVHVLDFCTARGDHRQPWPLDRPIGAELLILIAATEIYYQDRRYCVKRSSDAETPPERVRLVTAPVRNHSAKRAR